MEAGEPPDQWEGGDTERGPVWHLTGIQHVDNLTQNCAKLVVGRYLGNEGSFISSVMTSRLRTWNRYENPSNYPSIRLAQIAHGLR